MQVGTETFLTYVVSFDFTNKPKNMKFYRDASKTQEILLENDKYTAYNGFISLDSNKKRTQTYYWDWPFQTGKVDENGIAEGDADDTAFMGKTMSMNITATGTQVLANTLEGKVATTIINGNLEVHDTVQKAFNTADNHSGALITLLENQSVDGLTVADSENIVLDLNGKTLTMNGNFKNSGVLTIENSTGTGKITSTMDYDSNNPDKCFTIANKNGTLNIISGTIESTESGGIYNEGDNSYVNIFGGTIKAKFTSIKNNGNSVNPDLPAVKVTGGIVTSSGGNTIHNSKNCTGLMVLSGGRIENTSTDNVGRPCVINCAGKILIDEDVVVTSVFPRTVLQYQDSGCIEIAGGIVENTYEGNEDHAYAIGLEGTGSIIISGGKITSKVSYGIYSSGTSSESVIISGGTVTGKTYGLFSNLNGTITVGTKGGGVSATSPIIVGQSKDGLYIRTGTLNFYDGIIYGSTSVSSNGAISGSGTVVPEAGYMVVTGTEIYNGIEYKFSTLGKI